MAKKGTEIPRASVKVFAHPTGLTHELADKICARLVGGESLRAICASDGFPSQTTVWRWRCDDPAFNERIVLASPTKKLYALGSKAAERAKRAPTLGAEIQDSRDNIPEYVALESNAAERAPRESALTSGIKDTREGAPQPYLERTTPLAIMLARMTKLWNDGKAPEADQREAVSIAKDAAPYVHAKLSSVEARVTRRDLSELGELELLEELAALRGRDDPGEGDRAALN